MATDITIDLPSGPMDAYLAEPSGDAPFGAVLVLHEAFGLNDDIRSIADRVAGLGYVALAPDIVEGGRMSCMARAMIDLTRGEGPTTKSVEQCIDWLAGRADVDGDRIGAVGFCLGGGLAFLAGLSGKLAAIAPNYGQPPGDLSDLERSCPVVASYGGRDLVMGRHADRVRDALDAAGVEHDVVVYQESGHSFMNRSKGHAVMKAMSRPLMRIGYNPADAEDAWRRIESFFARFLQPV
jgi:carboxymethylenebutenolidase